MIWYIYILYCRIVDFTTIYYRYSWYGITCTQRLDKVKHISSTKNYSSNRLLPPLTVCRSSKRSIFWYLAARTAGCVRNAGFKPQSHRDSLLGCLTQGVLSSVDSTYRLVALPFKSCVSFTDDHARLPNVCMLQGIQFQLLKGIRIYSGWWFQTFFIFHNIWDNPSHWLIFFREVETTNQLFVVSSSDLSTW